MTHVLTLLFLWDSVTMFISITKLKDSMVSSSAIHLLSYCKSDPSVVVMFYTFSLPHHIYKDVEHTPKPFTFAATDINYSPVHITEFP